MTRPNRFAGHAILSLPERTRQSRIVNCALAAFVEAGSARDFLNAYHPGLEGRPLDLATASDGGLAAVERELASLTAAGVA